MVRLVKELGRKFTESDLARQWIFRVKKKYLIRQVHDIMMITGIQLKHKSELQGL